MVRDSLYILHCLSSQLKDGTPLVKGVCVSGRIHMVRDSLYILHSPSSQLKDGVPLAQGVCV